MRISAIAAMSLDRVIGADNQIPWHLPADLRFFMRTTKGHHVIMGRKNYIAMGKPLAHRTNIVITRNPYFISSGCVVVHSLEEALSYAHAHGEKEAFIIGGGQIYLQSLPLWDRIYLTTIDLHVDGDVFFPEFDLSEWQLVSEDHNLPDDKNPYSFTIQIFDRISHINQ